MTIAYYMNFVDGHHGSLNRIGGQPSFAPAVTPWAPEDNGYFAFVGEFDVDGESIVIPTVLKILLFQPLDDGDDPTPLVGIVRRTEGNTNSEFKVPTHPLAQLRDIHLDRRNDPDVMPNLDASLEVAHLFKSKLSGVDPWLESGPTRRFIGQLREFESGLNFGGRTCCLYYLEEQDTLLAELK